MSDDWPPPDWMHFAGQGAELGAVVLRASDPSAGAWADAAAVAGRLDLDPDCRRLTIRMPAHVASAVVNWGNGWQN
eukprot:10537577-Alexandrium_andersonii.AAC.1